MYLKKEKKHVLFTFQFPFDAQASSSASVWMSEAYVALSRFFLAVSYSTKVSKRKKIKNYKSNILQKHHLCTSVKISEVFSPRNVYIWRCTFQYITFFINYLRYFLQTLTGNFENSFVGWIAALIANVVFVEFLVLNCGQKHSFSSSVSHLTGTASTPPSSRNSTTAYLYSVLQFFNFKIFGNRSICSIIA